MRDCWFYTEPRYPDEYPLHSRIRIKSNPLINDLYAAGRVGTVVGYRSIPESVPNMPCYTGWHYIRFDDDAEIYPDAGSMPYVHRIYLEPEQE